MKFIKTLLPVAQIDEYGGHLRIFPGAANYKDVYFELYVPLRVIVFDVDYVATDIQPVLDGSQAAAHKLAQTAAFPAQMSFGRLGASNGAGHYFEILNTDLSLVDANTAMGTGRLWFEAYLVEFDIVSIKDTIWGDASSKNDVVVNAGIANPLPVIVFNDYAHPMIIRDDHFGSDPTPNQAENDGFEIIYPYQFSK
jgi:hypothetical protein